MRGFALGQDIVHMAGVAALASHGIGDLVRADQADFMVAAAGRRADTEFEIRGRLDLIAALPRDVERDRLLALERTHALPNLAEVAAAAPDTGFAADQARAGLAPAGGRLEALAGLKPVQLEADMAPAGALGGHAMDQPLPVGPVVLEQQFSHRLLPVEFRTLPISPLIQNSH